MRCDSFRNQLRNPHSGVKTFYTKPRPSRRAGRGASNRFPLLAWLFRRRLLGERLDGLGGEADALAVHYFRLEVHREFPLGGDIGMASGVTGTGPTAGQLTHSAHSRGLEILQGLRYHGNRFLARGGE